MNKERIRIRAFETLNDLMQVFNHRKEEVFGDFMAINNKYEAVEDYNGSLLFGLLYYNTGLKPKFIVKNNNLFLGFDKEIICFSCNNKKTYGTIKLSSLFHDLIDPGIKDRIVIICELDIYAINEEGMTVWTMRFRDIIADFEMIGKEKIKIVTFDGDETVFLIENGEIL